MSLLLNLWYQHQDAITKTLLVMAAPGGIWFWIDKYRSRVRVLIRHVRLSGTEQLGIAFEAENVSSTLTSFEPTLKLTGYEGRWRRVSYIFTANSDDRRLTPHVATQIVAIPDDVERHALLFLWHMTLTMTLTRGRKVHVRILNSEFKTVGMLRLRWERFCHLAFGRLP
jgi:hypothetical protein